MRNLRDSQHFYLHDIDLREFEDPLDIYQATIDHLRSTSHSVNINIENKYGLMKDSRIYFGNRAIYFSDALGQSQTNEDRFFSINLWTIVISPFEVRTVDSMDLNQNLFNFIYSNS